MVLIMLIITFKYRKIKLYHGHIEVIVYSWDDDISRQGGNTIKMIKIETYNIIISKYQ